MAVRRHHPLLRAAPAAATGPRPSRRQAVALLAVLVVVAGVIAAVSYLVTPDRARAFSLVGGSVFLSDSVAPVAVDLASGHPTVRLVQAAQEVGAKSTADLTVTPLQDGTLLLDRRTGEFNMVAPTGFVEKTTGGVPLAALRGSTGTAGIASGQNAYLEQTGPTGTAVYLVNESTVQSAGVTGPHAKVKPRAVRSMPEAGSTAPGASAAADGDLWLLVGSGATRTVRRLHLPAGSAPGVTLTSSDHGRVPAVSAIEATGTRGEAPDTGPAAVGVASGDSIHLFDAGSERTVHFTAVAGADTVLAAGDATGRLAFLVHGTAGWYSVSVAADGSDLRGPTELGSVPSGADLASPGMSEGDLYTLDRTTGQVYRIDASGRTTDEPDYPLARQNGKAIEPGGFGDAYVIARGSRVIVNSPTHLDALVLFTDGSHPPLTIEKSSAVSVSASDGADALTRSRHTDGKGGRTSRSAPKKQPVEPVNNNVDCKDTRQKPHIPSIISAAPGSRSVALAWTYPTPDPQDCQPSTYVVGIKLISDNAPSPPGSVRVQGQTSVNLAGLFPSTQYQVTVTAYINGQGTSSVPRLVTTGPAGPAAPTDVTATPDDAGNWDVTWRSCGTVAQGCVPSSSWKVVPEFCDGRGLSGAPAPITVTADPTTAVQPPAQLAGGDALLGRGVRFQVEGIGDNNAVGTPSAYTACTYSWSAPDAGGITVSASTPPTTSAQQTTATTATVRFADGAVHDLGGVGGTLTYALLDANGDVVSTKGPTTDTSVSLGGIVPGEQYSVRVTATPPRHPDSAVTLAPVAVVPAQETWPDPNVDATFAKTDFDSGTLSVSFGLGGIDVHGETFDLQNDQLVCGSEGESLEQLGGSSTTGVSPGQTLTFPVDRFTFHGSCSVQLQLAQHGANATLFGSSDSPRGTDAVSIDEPSITATSGSFSANWSGSYTNPQISVNYQGQDLLGLLANNWQIVASNGSSSNCGSSGTGPNTTLPIDSSCVNAGGSFAVSIGYTYLGQAQHFTVSVTGNAPNPVTSGDVDFSSAAWNTDADNPAVVLSYDGSASQSSLQNLDWTETVTSNNQTCGTNDQAPGGDGTVSVPVDYSSCPVDDANGQPNTFTVTVTFHDPTYHNDGGPYSPPIDGTPPQ